MAALTAQTQPSTPSPRQSQLTPPSPPSASSKDDDDAFRPPTPQKRPSPCRDMSPARRVQRRLEASVNPYARSPSETEVENDGSGRTEDERRSPKGRRAREEFVRDEVVVPSHAVGFIIGRQGETIRAIMASSGAHVSMDKHFPGPDRKFDITGTEEEVAKCREVMLHKLDVVRERSQDRSSSVRGSEESFEMWIPQSKIGLVIGAGGSNIRVINERSGAHCTVQNDRVQGDQKLLMVYGSRESIRVAEDMIMDILHARAETKAIYIPRDAVRFVIGKNGAMIKNLMMRSGATIRVSSEDGEERLVTIQGSARVIEEAHNMIERVIERGFNQERFQRDRERRVENGTERLVPKKTTRETFELSAEHIGLLIGKNGVTIREMQNRSGATIEVSGKNESEREASTRTVTIVGSKAQVKIAKILIEEKLGLYDDDGENESGPLEAAARASAKDEIPETRASNDVNDKGNTDREQLDAIEEKARAPSIPKSQPRSTRVKESEESAATADAKAQSPKTKKDGKSEQAPPPPPPHHYGPYMHPSHGQYPPHYPPPPMYGEHMPPYPYYGQPPPSGHGMPPPGYPPHPGMHAYPPRDKYEAKGEGKKKEAEDKEEKQNESEKKEKNSSEPDSQRRGMAPYYGGYSGHPLPYPPPMYGGYPYGTPPPQYKQRAEKETAS